MPAPSEQHYPIIINLHMFADAGDNDCGTLLAGFFEHQLCHDVGVVVVEMRYRLVGYDKIEGLNQGSHHSHTLLLSKRHEANLAIHLVGYAKALEPRKDGLLVGMLGDAILDLHILKGCELREETQLLEKHADMVAANGYPVANAIGHGVDIVELKATAIVATIAKKIAAESALALSALCFDKIFLAFFEL